MRLKRFAFRLHRRAPSWMACTFLCLASLGVHGSTAAAEEELRLKTERFDTDPGWDNSVNRVELANPPTIAQDFGWSPGKIGGTVHRSITPAWYGMPLEKPLSFHDAFSASGKIAVNSKTSDFRTAVYLGFFNHERQGWRPWASMALRVVNGGRRTFFFVDYMTGLWNAGAAETELTIPSDGSEHTWSFTYDPKATREPWSDFKLHSWLSRSRQTPTAILERARKDEPDLTPQALEERLQTALAKGLVSFLARRGERYWLLNKDQAELKGAVTFQVDGGPPYCAYLEATLQAAPVVLDRFGIFNMQLPGGAVTFYASDLTVNEKKIDLGSDPGWESHGSRVQFVDRDFVRQNFGYSADTSHAGGQKGEIGGLFYNVEPVNPLHGFYADEVGQLTLDDPLHFSGKISFMEGSTDAGMFFGFFRAEDEKRTLPPNIPGTGGSGWPQPNVLGMVVDGPSRVGWFFTSVCTAAERSLMGETRGHVFLPTRRPRTFQFDYDPTANGGVGRVTVALDAEAPFTLDLTAAQRQAGATFDHFGLMSFRRGGKYSILYFDDLTYTTRHPANDPALRHEQKVTTVPHPQ